MLTTGVVVSHPSLSLLVCRLKPRLRLASRPFVDDHLPRTLVARVMGLNQQINDGNRLMATALVSVPNPSAGTMR